MKLTPQFVDETVNKPKKFKKLNSSLSSSLFFVEPKYDGERVLLLITDEKIRIANKHKSIYGEFNLPDVLLEAIDNSIEKNGMYDAEFYSLDGNLYNFLSARANITDDLALAIWDMPFLKRETLRDRKKVLRENISTSERVKVVDDQACETKKEILKAFNRYVNNGFEGAVVKPNAGYNAKWYKLKEQYTSDLAVLGVKRTDKWETDQIPFTFLLGYYESGEWVRVGDVSSGLDDPQREAISEIVPEIKRESDTNYVYLDPELVFEVQFHQKTEKGLREPKILRIRYDKPAKETNLNLERDRIE